MSTLLQEPVLVRFRGHERALPLASIALTFRRSPERTASSLEYLIQGPPEDRSPTTPGAPVPLPPARGEGERGWGTSETLEPGTNGSETSGSETLDRNLEERSGPERSERERSDGRARDHEVDDATLARMIAIDLGDEDNLGAIRKLVAAHPRALVDQALVRALAVPADRVRSSRGAIFTGIVRRLERDARSSTP